MQAHLLDCWIMKKSMWRAAIEVGFVVFLFYSNLLMGEFERSGRGSQMGFVWAVGDIFTAPNFVIAITSGLIGYVVFEFLRSKF
jgi:hypothetical protein